MKVKFTRAFRGLKEGRLFENETAEMTEARFKEVVAACKAAGYPDADLPKRVPARRTKRA